MIKIPKDLNNIDLKLYKTFLTFKMLPNAGSV